MDLFSVLLERYSPRVWSIARNHVPAAEVEEVAHEAFVEIYQSLGNYQRRSPFEHWLSRLTVRCCYRFWKKQRRQREVAVTELSREGQDWLESLKDEKAVAGYSQGAEELLNWARKHLSAENIMVLNLIYREQYTVAEAAQLLGWTRVNVKVRSYRARKELRRLLKQKME